MRRTCLWTVAGLGLVFSFATANADDSSECLVSLAASAPGATTSRGGQMITATADTSGKCTFSVTACVNDTTIAGCSAGTINQVRIGGTGGSAIFGGLQQALQAQLPTSQRACSTANVTVDLRNGTDSAVLGHRRVRGAATSADGRRDAD